MNDPLHIRLQALRDFLAPPSANALTPPGLDLLDEVIKRITPSKAGEPAPTAVEMPWPPLSAGIRLVTGAYPRNVVADYGNARAAERDAFWQAQVNRLTAERDAYELLADRRPLQPRDLDKLRDETFSTGNPFCPIDQKSFDKVAAAVERAHGIKA